MAAYLDTNIFIYAVTNQGALGRYCRGVLDDVKSGKISGITSTLTFDEATFAVSKLRSPSEAIEFAEQLLTMPNLKLVNLDVSILTIALKFMHTHRLQSGDAIHAATAVHSGTDVFYSQDSDFRKIKLLHVKLFKGS